MSSVAERVRAVGELREALIAMRRQALKREHPEEGEERLDERLRSWVLASDPPAVGKPGDASRS
jgi:hypothetical protein